MIELTTLADMAYCPQNYNFNVWELKHATMNFVIFYSRTKGFFGMFGLGGADEYDCLVLCETMKKCGYRLIHVGESLVFERIKLRKVNDGKKE